MHFYCFGKTSSGKTTLLKTLMREDLMAGRGFTFVDVHGDAAQEMMEIIRLRFPHRKHLYLDATDPNLTLAYNPLRHVSVHKRSLVASNILEIFQRNWKSAWGMKMEHILRMLLLILLEQPRSNLSDILRLLHDRSFRSACLPYVRNPDVRTFLTTEFPKYKPSDLLPIMNKVGALLSHDMVRKILVENTEQLSLRTLMDQGTVLIVNLAKGAVGSDVSNILAGLLLTSFSSAAFSRIDTPPDNRRPHFLYLDEFQGFSGTELIGELLAQIRKFRIGLILCNQFLHQLEPEVRASILGNVGTLVAFRLGIQDARLMEKEFWPEFKAGDFTSLPNGSIYLRLMIGGKPSKPFSADTIL